jgi:F0F1-type ATP synthase assembly protein I
MASPDRKAKEQKRIEGIGFRLAGIGGEFASNVVAGLLIGWGIDWYFECRPWGIVGGAAAGLAVGTLQFIRQAVALNRQMGPVTPPPGGFKEVPPEVDGPELEGPLPEEEADRADARKPSRQTSRNSSRQTSRKTGGGGQ